MCGCAGPASHLLHCCRHFAGAGIGIRVLLRYHLIENCKFAVIRIAGAGPCVCWPNQLTLGPALAIWLPVCRSTLSSGDGVSVHAADRSLHLGICACVRRSALRRISPLADELLVADELFRTSMSKIAAKLSLQCCACTGLCSRTKEFFFQGPETVYYTWH